TNAAISDLRIPTGALMAAKASTSAIYEGNLQSDAATGTVLTRDIPVYDSKGNKSTVSLQFTKAATGWSVSTDGGVTSTAMTFAAGGALTSPTSLTTGGVTVDLSTITGYAGVNTVKALSQDGYPAGTLESFSLGSDGVITGTFSNSLKQVIGQIAIASFNNPAGLEKAGGSLFQTTANSGLAQVGTPGSGGRGSLVGGSLEMSNVDLSQEFTSLIIAQRGFQANSRIITTSDTILEELINLKR
ncbi:MAG: flagellar hook-basal body complex protein, partial [Actinobacteria bacterium]|nr:flagellar hook-basal body complex protein [Actinomycetota bacterium]